MGSFVVVGKRGTVTLAIGHVALPCLCSCMSDCNVPKYTSCEHAAAKEVYRARGLDGALKQAGLQGSNVLGHETDALYKG